MNLLEILQNLSSENAVSSLNQQLPQAQPNQTKTAMNVAMSALLNAVTRNTSNQGGLESLIGALTRDHSSHGLGDIMGMLGSNAPQNRATDGAGILSHLFGGNIFNIVELISKSSGLSRNSSLQTLMKMAPAVMGALGMARQQNNWQPNQLQQMLSQTVQQERTQRPQTSIVEKMLDRDGDGSVKDELVQMGMQALGSLFR